MNGNIEQTQFFQQGFSDFETFSDAVRGYDLDIRQLDSGSFSAHLQQIQCGNVFINRFTGTRRLEVFANSPPGLRTFGVPTFRCLPFTWRNLYSTGDTVQIYKSSTDFEMITHPFFEAIDISITEENFNILMHRRELPELDVILNKREMVSCNPVKLQQLRTTLHSVCATLDNDPDLLRRSTALQEIVQHEVPYLLAQTLMSSEDRLTNTAPEKRTHALRTAVDYIKTTPRESIALNRFCRETGINERTLQRAFRDQYGVSPKSYAQAFHLNNVYKSLKRSSPESTSIFEVASSFGYTHMGQFARDYRRHFGELPSDTLKG